jgi:3-phosphoshikimate 1-carboxyvinyltransferase
MQWKITRSRLAGDIAVPPSKSHTIRALLIAALADGRSRIGNPLLSGDGTSALAAAQALGAAVSREGDDLYVEGIGPRRDLGGERFDMGNSGTGTNLFMAAAALGSMKRRFDGDASLRSRPFRPLMRGLEQLGARVAVSADATRDLPFTIQGPLRGGKVTVDGVSSQFVSSLLLVTPLLAESSEITVENLQEKPYVELTLWWLQTQGMTVDRSADLSRFTVKGGQVYRPFDREIPADFSGAAFAACAGAMGEAGLRLTGLDFSDPQGDKGIFEILCRMGASVTHGDDASVTVARNGPLRGVRVDLNAMPDALPALAVVACAAGGETRIGNVAQARIKETDRIVVMREELTKMGGDLTEHEDGLTIRGRPLHGAAVDGHDDHRVVMALAIAALGAEGETIIDGAEAAAVTYPTFVDDFRDLGARIEVIA